jgi:transposase-like protein
MSIASDEYVKEGGSRCPFCKSGNIEGTAGFDYAGDMIFQDITCNSCGETWTDEYTLTGITVNGLGE